ncbi:MULTISPECIES: glycosyl hydrolase family 18 protein [Cytobacillus]|uniref:Chitinase n=1 Tax=Cytobacillus oceanisediminis 2691 TaxID=1196031 RepID=A0A169FP00_9BACI|nr:MULTISPECIES: glycosyl hydrolase family 18 protein [Cytobacillus]MBY0156102.1 LysM peptidoglycan-binding domain-containing protein [Cytobacillus firmus]AND39981.1 chitinase [Cytobacillus oceanisediminis 2691]MCM3395086.1 glycosyl hydrolase family 18 protein [Cytobacillus oceanisediminis]MCM3532504.1 glycosyl hydrolase family 18 protein [Cytobacillus oceanisediminis]UQX55700.1 glycosyl hydrolase family 18 protein [Cytobacillus pseudoceanisediminis]
MGIHIVQAGDSLWAISQKYNVPTLDIRTANGLENGPGIIPGLALYIPESGPVIRSYLVKPGDTLWSISQRFQTTINLILSANPEIRPEGLYIGQKLNIPSPSRLVMKTLGFIVPYSPDTFLPAFRETAKNLTYIAISAYSLTREGYAYIELDDSAILAESRRLDVIPLLMIRNLAQGEFNAELIGGVLESPANRRNLILSLMNFVTQKGYGGISLDFEFIPPPRRQDFNSFIRELKNALGPKVLHVNVHAKTEDLPANRIIGAYDYKAIGEGADIVAVMTMDYGYPTGPPNPVAPLWWVEEVIQYSITQIDPKKLQIALPLYGYDWRTADNLTRSFSMQAIQNLALSRGAVIQFDAYAASPWFRYWNGEEEHVVWFEDIRSITEKYKLIDQYNLLGMTYWQLSLRFPQNWAFADKNFTIL